MLGEGKGGLLHWLMHCSFQPGMPLLPSLSSAPCPHPACPGSFFFRVHDIFSEDARGTSSRLSALALVSVAAWGMEGLVLGLGAGQGVGTEEGVRKRACKDPVGLENSLPSSACWSAWPAPWEGGEKGAGHPVRVAAAPPGRVPPVLTGRVSALCPEGTAPGLPAGESDGRGPQAGSPRLALALALIWWAASCFLRAPAAWWQSWETWLIDVERPLHADIVVTRLSHYSVSWHKSSRTWQPLVVVCGVRGHTLSLPAVLSSPSWPLELSFWPRTGPCPEEVAGVTSSPPDYFGPESRIPAVILQSQQPVASLLLPAPELAALATPTLNCPWFPLCTFPGGRSFSC